MFPSTVCSRHPLGPVRDPIDPDVSARIDVLRAILIGLTVTDTGGGIPENMRERVFDPFCTTKESGTGLGLAVCQRIAEDHHGDIRFTTSGAGTTFILEIPLGA